MLTISQQLWLSTLKVHLPETVVSTEREENETSSRFTSSKTVSSICLEWDATKLRKRNQNSRETAGQKEDSRVFFLLIRIVCLPHHRHRNVCRTFYYRTSTGALSIVASDSREREFFQLFEGFSSSSQSLKFVRSLWLRFLRQRFLR